MSENQPFCLYLLCRKKARNMIYGEHEDKEMKPVLVADGTWNHEISLCRGCQKPSTAPRHSLAHREAFRDKSYASAYMQCRRTWI